MNVGAQSRTVSSFIEKDVGFWAANLMSLCAISAGLAVFCLSTKKLSMFPCIIIP